MFAMVARPHIQFDCTEMRMLIRNHFCVSVEKACTHSLLAYPLQNTLDIQNIYYLSIRFGVVAVGVVG